MKRARTMGRRRPSRHESGYMSKADPIAIAAVMEQVHDALAATRQRPAIIGICGTQASGKSTLAAALVQQLNDEGLNAAALSIDDIYLPRSAREELAKKVHPLFVTRGVPGTHDIGQGLALIEAMKRGEAVMLPRFDKLRDNPAPETDWTQVPAGCDVLIVEGWCIGAIPQPVEALEAPVNSLEAEEDPQATWRIFANTALMGGYQDFFGRMDRLVLLAAPRFEIVATWRLEQEHGLAKTATPNATVMDGKAVARFVSHYERLTRHILTEMPGRADLLVELDERRNILSISNGNH